ncbi:unnamed protein product [Cladocopium goreaui]|uniref:Uncharacterized protein n=1 Tax=Cladocopium goreaui TaxID=2562237 RepID=A0A9P1GIS7_9DINO|nr:unnamed protein product [Cladocopium goreaui]
MEVRPESVEDWCSLMPNLLEADGWHLACSVANSQLMHGSCPWGGRLIKFQLRDIRVKNAPQNAGTLIIRPEVRSLQQRNCSINGINIKSWDFIAPGEAIVHASVSCSIVRLCSVLFGDLAAQVMTCFYDDRATSVAWHQMVRRNFPTDGDSACAFWMEDAEQPYEYLILTRPQEEKEMFTVFVIARVYEDRFANWASRHFALVLRQARRTAESCLNRPGVVELRRADERFYVVLSMQSFKRGMPLVPALPGEHCVTDIDAGQPLGLRRWTRFEPDDLENPKFQLSQYIGLFVERLGFPIETFDTLDGQTLVPYQCVVRRDAWEAVRQRFNEAYPLQKTAYRHANGGSGAPGMHEDVMARFVPVAPKAWNMLEEQLAAAREPKLVVRKTFLEMQEDEHAEVGRPARRPKTLTLGRAGFRAH